MSASEEDKAEEHKKAKEPKKLNWAFIITMICVFLVVFVFGSD